MGQDTLHTVYDLPRFILLFGYNTQEQKSGKKRGRPGSIYHVNDVWRTQDGRRVASYRGCVGERRLSPPTQPGYEARRRGTPFFAALPLPCIVLNTNQRTKWEGPGNEAKLSILYVSA